MVTEEQKAGSQFNEYKYPLLVIGGAVIITIGLAFLIGRPLYASMQKTNAELAEKQTVLEKLETKLANLKNLESRQEELKQENETVLAALPEDKGVARLFVQFEKVASASGLSITSVSEGSDTAQTQTTTEGIAAPTGGISPVSYSVNGTATNYAALKKALGNFEEALRLLSITNLDISSSGKTLDVNLTVNTYKRNQ